MSENRAVYVTRPEILHAPSDEAAGFAVTAAPLGFWAKLYANGTVRKSVLLVLLAAAWEIYARMLSNPLLFPTSQLHGRRPVRRHRHRCDSARGGLHAVTVFVEIGYVTGLVFAALLTAFASMSRIGADLLETLTAMFNPLPSIALLPLALIWFGLADGSVIFVPVHAVLWAVALNTFAGFRALSPTLRMVGQNYGLSSFGCIVRIPDSRRVPEHLDRP